MRFWKFLLPVYIKRDAESYDVQSKTFDICFIWRYGVISYF
jgi:hypothetical protein